MTTVSCLSLKKIFNDPNTTFRISNYYRNSGANLTSSQTYLPTVGQVIKFSDLKSNPNTIIISKSSSGRYVSLYGNQGYLSRHNANIDIIWGSGGYRYVYFVSGFVNFTNVNIQTTIKYSVDDTAVIYINDVQLSSGGGWGAVYTFNYTFLTGYSTISVTARDTGGTYGLTLAIFRTSNNEFLYGSFKNTWYYT